MLIVLQISTVTVEAVIVCYSFRLFTTYVRVFSWKSVSTGVSGSSYIPWASFTSGETVSSIDTSLSVNSSTARFTFEIGVRMELARPNAKIRFNFTAVLSRFFGWGILDF